MSYKLTGDIIGLDLGKARTGVARLNTIARIAEPMNEIAMSDKFLVDVQKVVSESKASGLVVGIPRSLDGKSTDQTIWAENVYESLKNSLEIPVFNTDEAMTTKKAEERAHPGQSIDSVAAGIILEDFANEVLEGRVENVSF